jgi:hypothetical protein
MAKRNFARCLADTGRLEASQQLLDDTAEDLIANPHDLAVDRMDRAHLASRAHNLGQAEQLLAMVAQDLTTRPTVRAKADVQRAEALIALGRHEEALDCLARADPELQEPQHVAWRLHEALCAISAYTALGDPQKVAALEPLRDELLREKAACFGLAAHGLNVAATELPA